MADHGLVLKPENADYTDLTQFGSVTIEQGADGRTVIYVQGFEFDEAASCRQDVAKAMAWARDLLDAAVRCQLLVPGGPSQIVSAID